ncbi:MAG: DoxX family protein [Pseudomonadota bacterium]|nr:DoxX family protein [Pseudomonadota bacterium]
MILSAQIIATLLAVFFLVTGWLKASGHPHMIEEFDKFQYPHWLRILAGVLELIAAPAMLLAWWWPHWASLGALVISAVMVGATYTNFVKRPAVFGWGTVVILLLCVYPAVVLFPLQWLSGAVQ